MISSEDTLAAALPTALPSLVFVLGAHRSGTTFLHQCLADTGHFAHVSPFDLINFDRLLQLATAGIADAERTALDAELRAAQPDRGLDECAVGANVAEEYGFVIPKAGEFSFFTPSLTDASRPRFELLCRKKLHLDPARRPLVLKNPDDFYSNLDTLQRFYPAAKLIFIHRHPLAVFNSQLKTWIGALEKDNAYYARLHPYYRHVLANPDLREAGLLWFQSRGGAGTFLERFAAGFRHYLAVLPRLAPGSWISLRYEDLCADPDARFAEVCAFLGVPPPTTSLRAAVKPRPLRVLPVADLAFAAGGWEFKDYLASQGYGLRPEGLVA